MRTLWNAIELCKDRFLKHRLILSLVMLGLLLRVFWLLASSSADSSGPDSLKYLEAAKQIRLHGVFASSEILELFGIAYPTYIFLASFGTLDATLVILLQILLFALLSLWLSVLLFGLLGQSAILLTFLLSFSPIMIDTTASLMYEAPLLIATLALTINTILIYKGTDKLSREYKFNVFLFASLLIFISAIHLKFLPIASLIALFTRTFSLKFRLILSFIVIPLPSLVMGIRNYYIYNDFFVSSNTGVTLLTGLNLDWKNTYPAICKTVDLSSLSIAEQDTALQACSYKLISTDPLYWMSLIPRKLLEHFEPFLVRFLPQPSSFEGVLFSGPTVIQLFSILIFIMIFSVAISNQFVKSQLKFMGLLSTLTVTFVVSAIESAVFFGYARYRVMSLPFLYISFCVFFSYLIHSHKFDFRGLRTILGYFRD